LALLPHEGKEWYEALETSWCDDDWCKDEVKWAREFKKPLPPPGKHTPFAGIARYLHDHKEKWNEFGYLNWECEFETGSVFSRQFENGRAFGVFPSNTEDRGGEMYILWQIHFRFDQAAE
jgi:hypothetical protein